jgi:Na+/H+ antiporter NhaA
MSGPASGLLAGRTTWVRSVARPVRVFVATEVGSAVILLAAAVAALVWANSPWGASYDEVWSSVLSIRLAGAELSQDLRGWVNDGLMTLFFFVIGLEIRRELDMGDLRDRRRVAVPVLAAIGGMAAPALIYLAFNAGTGAAHGWGTVMATDTAFALGVLALVGGRCSLRVRVFVLTLVVVDDVGALTVIALAYTEDLSPVPLLVAAALFAVVIAMRWFGVRRGPPYLLLGVALWLALLGSGVNPTLAGVAMGLLATAHPPSRTDLQQAASLWRSFREQPTYGFARSASRGLNRAISPNERMQEIFHPWTSYVIVPLFALANAGVPLGGEALRRAATSPITLGIVAGLVIGKPVGIAAASWLATRRRLGGFPITLPWPPVVAAAAVCGIGFTVSLFIAELSFDGTALADAKIGILAASIIATGLGWLMFRLTDLLPERIRLAGLDRTVAPIADLAEPVDAGRDHIRGPADAPVTLVEYGDFECPYCGQAEPVVRTLLSEFGQELRYVFRHLPLEDVHEHAQQAAEAAEAAGAQGKFWEMHDLLFAHQGALETDDLIGYARELGLDADVFADKLRRRKFARRVERDVESADESGVTGTPTFFANGRRHHGAYDVASLTELVRSALAQSTRGPSLSPARTDDD